MKDRYPIRTISPAEIPLLSEIPDPPHTMFARGSLPDMGLKFLCVVGARKYTPYGRQAAETLIGYLAGYPIAIVSGLALGIDGIAHRAALSAGLPTVAIPGSGLSDAALYPRSHVGLAHDILAHSGALVSEFAPEFRARPESFPQRNRLMAGMSHAVLVVEAAERSGTLITARLAMEYNRDVCAVPGPIFSENTAGPHSLIKNGATPVTKSADILDALGIAERGAREAAEHTDLTEDERLILSILSAPKAKDELITMLPLPTSEANILLSKMELKHLITERYGMLYNSRDQQ